MYSVQLREKWYFAFLMWASWWEHITGRLSATELWEGFSCNPTSCPQCPFPLPTSKSTTSPAHSKNESTWVQGVNIFLFMAIPQCSQMSTKIALVSVKFKMWPKTHSNIQLQIFFRYWRACNKKAIWSIIRFFSVCQWTENLALIPL